MDRKRLDLATVRALLKLPPPSPRLRHPEDDDVEVMVSNSTKAPTVPRSRSCACRPVWNSPDYNKTDHQLWCVEHSAALSSVVMGTVDVKEQIQTGAGCAIPGDMKGIRPSLIRQEEAAMEKTDEILMMSPIACFDAEHDPDKEAVVLQWRAHQLRAEEEGAGACHCSTCRAA